MGDFFEDLGKKITETAGAVTKKTEEMMETQKIKSQIRLEERNKENALQELGKQVYDRYRNGEIVDADFVGLCEAIEQYEEAVQSCLKELAELKGMTLCKNCNGELQAEMVYCPKCGTKVEEEIYFEEETENEPAFEEEPSEEKDTEMQVVEEAAIVEEDE